MVTHHKVGRKTEAKTWEPVLRHTFRTSYAEDSDLHTLMFIAGDQLSLIIQAALKDFAAKHSIPTSDPEFQSKVFLSAATHYSKHKESPTACAVLGELDRMDVFQDLMGSVSGAASSAPELRKTPVSKPVAASVRQTAVLSPVLPAQKHTTEPAIVNPSSVKRKPTKAAPIDFGPGEDEVDADSETSDGEQKPSMRDKWLKNHNY
jgi:hypothetical protein